MKKRESAPEERRVVTKKKKAVILVLFAVGLVGIVLFKLPYERSYSASLMLRDAGERPLYGETVNVKIRVKVQRYFFHDAVHTGTVTVGDDRYVTPERIERVPDLLGAFADTDTFTLTCSEWHGDYLLTRCIAYVADGSIENVYLLDGAGVYAGQYGPQPKGSQ